MGNILMITAMSLMILLFWVMFGSFVNQSKMDILLKMPWNEGLLEKSDWQQTKLSIFELFCWPYVWYRISRVLT